MTLRNPVGAGDHVRGPADAPVTIVEYGDYQCPYCGAVFPLVQQFLDRLGDRVRFVFRNFPIPDLHPEALNAALLAEYAADHGSFWLAHDLLFEHQSELGEALYRRICRTLGLSFDDFVLAHSNDVLRNRIASDEDGGLLSGVNGTPTFFVNGRRLPSGGAGLESAVITELQHESSRRAFGAEPGS